MANVAVSKEYKLPISKYKKSNLKFVGSSVNKTPQTENEFYTAGTFSSSINTKKGSITLFAQWVKPTSLPYASK